MRFLRRENKHHFSFNDSLSEILEVKSSLFYYHLRSTSYLERDLTEN